MTFQIQGEGGGRGSTSQILHLTWLHSVGWGIWLGVNPIWQLSKFTVYGPSSFPLLGILRIPWSWLYSWSSIHNWFRSASCRQHSVWNPQTQSGWNGEAVKRKYLWVLTWTPGDFPRGQTISGWKNISFWGFSKATHVDKSQVTAVSIPWLLNHFRLHLHCQNKLIKSPKKAV